MTPASAPLMLRPDNSRSIARRGADELRQQTGRRRREHADLDLGLAEAGVGRNEHQVAGERHFETAAQALPAHGDQHRHRRVDQLQHQRVNALEHRRALRRHMLLDAGAEAEMRTLGIEQDGARDWHS